MSSYGRHEQDKWLPHFDQGLSGHSYDELPLFLNAELVAKVLGVSISSAYELMHEEVFPSVRIGSRFVVPKDKFQQWVERQTGGAR